MMCCHLWSPIASREEEFCWRRAWVFQRVLLHGESGSGSYLKESGFTQLWWIQGMSSAILTGVRADKQQQRGLSNKAAVVEYFILLLKQHPLVYKGLWEFSG
jgi:hypothetical protein